MADDLARAIVDQLKVDDGPGPFALTHKHLNRHTGRYDEWMALMSERVNGRVVYQVNVASREMVFWHRVVYADPKAAAAFALAWLDAPHVTGDPDRKRYYRVELREVYRGNWAACQGGITQSFDECFNSKYGTFEVQCAADLQAAMLALVPVSYQKDMRQLGAKQ